MRGSEDLGASTLLTDSSDVPRVSSFYGIVIWLYYDEHPPPHFHATHGEHVGSSRLAPTLG